MYVVMTAMLLTIVNSLLTGYGLFADSTGCLGTSQLIYFFQARAFINNSTGHFCV